MGSCGAGIAAYAVCDTLRKFWLVDVDRELDAVADDDDGRVVAVASCKWTSKPLPLP